MVKFLDNEPAIFHELIRKSLTRESEVDPPTDAVSDTKASLGHEIGVFISRSSLSDGVRPRDDRQGWHRRWVLMESIRASAPSPASLKDIRH